MLDEIPLFTAKIEGERLKLTDYAMHSEEKQESIGVELGRLAMSLDELMQMKPGHALDLLPQGLSLSRNGAKVGSAEWVDLGEQSGLRILEL